MEPLTGASEYETHLTIRLDDATQISRLLEWAKEHELKCVHIVLDRGATASQPMLTRQGHGTFAEELATASEISRELNSVGFPVNRIKIEAPPWSHEVPNSTDEAATRSSSQYFEHHVKLLLGPSADMTGLMVAFQEHGAHLSRNALKQREDGRHERFVTQRCVSVCRSEAHSHLETLIDSITLLGYSILDVEEEYVVYDSNLGLDAGWIQSKGAGNEFSMEPTFRQGFSIQKTRLRSTNPDSG